MAFDVTFNFVDAFNRKTTRTWNNTNALIASVLTDVTAFVALYDAIGQGGVQSVLITQRSTADAIPAEGTTSVDENVSCQVIGGDGFQYDFNLPMPLKGTIILSDGSLDTSEAGVIAFFDEFLVGDNWRINLRNPTDIVTLVGGQLDK